MFLYFHLLFSLSTLSSLDSSRRLSTTRALLRQRNFRDLKPHDLRTLSPSAIYDIHISSLSYCLRRYAHTYFINRHLAPSASTSTLSSSFARTIFTQFPETIRKLLSLSIHVRNRKSFHSPSTYCNFSRISAHNCLCALPP
ncbi:hypothetical protein B0J14DRAFT_173468 [Halenospora varia]|nr:hypothetical protein B0J14DRAFT_173468 [Halenospora varia]